MGNLGSVVTFLLTSSFLFSPPLAVQLNHTFPVLGDLGKFLINDVMFLGASFWTASEALGAVQKSTDAYVVSFRKNGGLTEGFLGDVGNLSVEGCVDIVAADAGRISGACNFDSLNSG
jgi:hypothetical protein